MSDRKACVTSVARDARTRYHRLEGTSFRKRVDFEGQSQNEQTGFCSSIWSVRRYRVDRTKTRHDETFSRILDGHDEGEKEMTSN